MRVAFATCSAVRDGSPDDHAAGALLGADYLVWDDPAVDWDAYDRTMAEQGRTAVLMTPARLYSNQSSGA